MGVVMSLFQRSDDNQKFLVTLNGYNNNVIKEKNTIEEEEEEEDEEDVEIEAEEEGLEMEVNLLMNRPILWFLLKKNGIWWNFVKIPLIRLN